MDAIDAEMDECVICATISSSLSMRLVNFSTVFALQLLGPLQLLSKSETCSPFHFWALAECLTGPVDFL